MFKYSLVISLFVGSLSALWGNPGTPTVISGGAVTTSVVGPTATYTLTSEQTVLQWDTFSNSAGETVTFNATGGNPAYVFNKVVNGVSTINGSLTTNQSQNITVYLVNPNGVIIGPTGQVMTTGGFVASSLPLVGSFKPTDPSGMHFTGTDTSTFVQNAGTIVSTGDVILMGYRVSTTTTSNITATNTVAFGAGLDLLFKPVDATSQHIYIQTSQPPGSSGTGIDFNGKITAMNTFFVADCNPYALAINFAGVVNATGCSSAEGRVKLIVTCPTTPCSPNGVVQISGNVGRVSTTGQGSEFDVSANTIILTSTAVIDVRGQNAGGVVNIGCCSTSGNSSCPTAFDACQCPPSGNVCACPTANVCIDNGAQILANAITSGNGGQVNVFATNSLIFLGLIDVSGKGPTGNGGGVLFSSPGFLAVNGMINLSGSCAGSNGNLILCTSAINVGAPATVTSCAGSPCSLTTPTSFITQTSLQNILATGNVEIFATGQLVPGIINVVNSITWAPCTTLLLSSASEIHILALIQQNTPGQSTAFGVTLISPIITIGTLKQNHTFNAGVDIACGCINVQANVELNVLAGIGSNSYAILAARNGCVKIQFADIGQLNLLAGNGAGSNAEIIGATFVDIQAFNTGMGLMTVAASTCASAFVDSPIVNIGTTNPIGDLEIFGGSVGNGNVAYIGSMTQGSNIKIHLLGDLGIIGGPSGSSNIAGILSVNGFQNIIQIEAVDIAVAGGSGGIANTAKISSLGDLTNVRILAHQDLFVAGGPTGSTLTSAIIEGQTVVITTTRDLFITGGQGSDNLGSVYGFSGVNFNIGRNLSVLGGEASRAFAEIRADNGDIVLDSQTGVSTFSFRASNVGTDNAAARIFITQNGNIRIGQSSPPSFIEFIAGSRGTSPIAEALIGGNGDINIHALNDITLLGGGIGTETQAQIVIVGTGHATILGERDIILTTGISTSSNAGIQNNGKIDIISIRDTLLTGSCEIPNIAFFTAGSGNVTVTTGRDLLQRDITFIGPNPTFHVRRFNTVLSCSPVPPPPCPPCPSPCPPQPCMPFIPFPGYQWFKYTFLYELFYRLRYFGPMDFYELHDYFWDTTTYVSP